MYMTLTICASRPNRVKGGQSLCIFAVESPSEIDKQDGDVSWRDTGDA